MSKNFLKKFFIIALELAVISGLLWFIIQKREIKSVDEIVPAIQQTIQDVKQESVQENVQSKEEIPLELSGPVEKTFSWEYAGKKYSLNQTLYTSVYNYYKSQNKEYVYSGTLPNNWEEEYYAMFLKTNDADKSISEVASGIQNLGKKNNLTDNQIVDLTLAFVQSIKYDDAKAKNILAQVGNETMLFPYETLYEQSGVCSDKSLLAYALLRQMGYGAALFIYKQENHMAVAVQCPKNYSTYGSGYCYGETTSVGNKIGIIPVIDTESNKTVSLSNYNFDQSQQMNLKDLGQVTINLPSEGNEYSGIIQTEKLLDQINQLKKSMENLLPELKSEKNNINKEVESLNEIKDSLDGYKKDGNVDEYNSSVEKYNNLLATYEKDLKEYNNNATLYNQDVKKYNTLIEQ